MDKRTEGAWLLAHSKNLDHVSGPGALRLENISYAGKIGRLYNVLRRGSNEAAATVIDASTVTNLCQLNNIDRASRNDGLQVLQHSGRVDVTSDGSVAVLGATTGTVLETAADVFENSSASRDERAVLMLSEEVAARPISRSTIEQLIGDTHKIKSAQASDLVELCKTTALVDEESIGDRYILFNSNTFREKERAKKAYAILQGLKPDEASRLTELEELLRQRGAVLDMEAEHILGSRLYTGLASAGYFDRMEVNNLSESVGYIALPDAFQRYGRPFEEDPVDDAKALLAALTYGMTRSSAARGKITLPLQLLNALIAGREVGGYWGAAAIGQDYVELERRGVVQVTRAGNNRFRMRLLKPDVGILARTIIVGGRPAEEAILLGAGPATGFKGPDETRKDVRRKNKAEDRVFVANALDRIRSGGG
jgi:hypothetical protein